jgi:hypothetical protein
MPRLALPRQRRPYRKRTRRPGIADRAPTQDLSASRGPVRRIPQRRPAAISGAFGRLCDAWRQGVRSRPFRYFLGWVGENSVWLQPRDVPPKKRGRPFDRAASSASPRVARRLRSSLAKFFRSSLGSPRQGVAASRDCVEHRARRARLRPPAARLPRPPAPHRVGGCGTPTRFRGYGYPPTRTPPPVVIPGTPGRKP